MPPTTCCSNRYEIPSQSVFTLSNVASNWTLAAKALNPLLCISNFLIKSPIGSTSTIGFFEWLGYSKKFIDPWPVAHCFKVQFLWTGGRGRLRTLDRVGKLDIHRRVSRIMLYVSLCAIQSRTLLLLKKVWMTSGRYEAMSKGGIESLRYEGLLNAGEDSSPASNPSSGENCSQLQITFKVRTKASSNLRILLSAFEIKSLT